MPQASGMSEDEKKEPSEAAPIEPPPEEPVAKETSLTATPGTPPPPAPPEVSKEEKNWALAAHLSSFSYFVGIPGFVGPLVIWLVKKDEMPFVAEEAKESLNFQISIFLYTIFCVVVTLTFIGALVGIPGLLVIAILGIVFPIIGAIKAGEGKHYSYPMTIRLIS